jgi:hypothetical protein
MQCWVERLTTRMLLNVSMILLSLMRAMGSMRRVVDDRFDDFFKFHGLVQKMVRPKMPALFPVLGIVEVGQHDDRHFRIAILEGFEQLDAALSGRRISRMTVSGFRR